VTTLRKTRIAFLLPHLATGGVERIVLNLLCSLDRTRFEPVLIVRDRRGDLLAGVPGDVPVDDLGGARAFRAIPRLRRRLEEHDISLVYAGTNVSNLVAIAAAAMMRRPPAVIVSEHTPLSHHWAIAKWPRIRLAAMRLLYPRAWGIVVPIPEIAAEIRDLVRVDEERVHVLTNPVLEDVLCSSEGAPRETPADAPVSLVAAGRLERVKGFDILINAMGRLDGAYGDFRLTILGEGPERDRLETLADQLGLGARIDLPGRVSNPEDYYRRAFAVIVSSRFESGPNVLVESMAVGTPVIASDCPFGPRRILLNGKTGLLVPPEDPDAIAAAILRLWKDPDLYAQLREKGLQRARDYSIAAALPAYERLFVAAAQSREATGR